MMDFNRDSVFSLKYIEKEQINENILSLLLEGEEIVSQYRTVRDQLVFTDKRIIAMNIKGITGRKKELFTIPYKKIQYFSVQTVGFLELFPDAELSVFFSNGKVTVFEFKGDNEVLEISKTIARYTFEA